jgi:hypothetical protein
LTYSGQRLWLVRGDEVFIVRREADGGVSQLQLTQVRPVIRSLTGLRWSNSGLDEFVSFRALSSDEGGNTWACIYRLHVSGLEIAAALDAGGTGWVPFGPDDPDLELVHRIPFSQGVPVDFDESLPDGQDGLNIASYDWSTDGARLAYVLVHYDASEGASADSLMVRNVATGEEQAVLGGKFNDSVFEPRWSPDGSRIVTLGWLSVTTRKRTQFVQGIWTLDPDGSNARVVVPTSGNGQLGTAAWSPDSRFLVYELITQQTFSSSDEYDLIRVQADGSGATVLTGGLDPLTPKTLLNWR